MRFLYIKTLTGGLVHQVVLVGVDVVADGGHHHAVVPARLELVETEAGVLHQDTAAVPVESLQLMVSYLNNDWCQHSADVPAIEKCSMSSVRSDPLSAKLIVYNVYPVIVMFVMFVIFVTFVMFVIFEMFVMFVIFVMFTR